MAPSSRVMTEAERLVRELMGVHFDAPAPAEPAEPSDMAGVLELMASLVAVAR
jgi:hypothetical protein